jgi:sulfotransferase family protein
LKEENLIFIISQPRSGSTYLQNLLSNNEEVNTCSEPWVLLNYVNQIKPKLLEGVYDNKFAVAAYNNYKQTFEQLDFEALLKEHLLQIYKPLFESHTFAIDKTPRYWEIMEVIGEIFPKAKIIVLKREPLEVVRSLIKTYGMTTLKELNQFRRDILYAPKQLNKFCAAHSSNANVYTLRYEDLIADTEAQVKALYQWIGADFQPSVLDVSGNTKYRGHFGDPFQNAPIDYESSKIRSGQNVINKTFQKFLMGYAAFLGDKFLIDYGNYTADVSLRKTNAFKYFEFIGSEESLSQNKLTIKGILKKLYFQLIFE